MNQRVPATPADGNVKVAIATVIAGLAPTVAELADSVDISCYLTPDGFNYSVDQATITDDRLCSTESFAAPGRKTATFSLTGIDNTNVTEYEAEYNEMADVLEEGATRYAVSRYGLPFDEPFAAGQKVRLIPFRVGVKTEMAPEANSMLRSTWAAFVSGPSDLVEIAA